MRASRRSGGSSGVVSITPPSSATMWAPSIRTTPNPRLAAPGSTPMTTFMGPDSAPRLGCLFAYERPAHVAGFRPMRLPRANDALVFGGRYRVLKRLGSGGMGASVLLAEDERLGRLVALKRLPTSSPEDALARFRREARLGASLNHPNVVSIFDSATD